ncbi:MAG: hypothetical protein WA857_04055 [Candidatus Acidiferrum sp.]
MTQESPPPPPFIVGSTYEDERGKYTVLSVEGARMTFERPDGSKNHTADIPLKARIHKRILSERQNPRPRLASFQQLRTGSRTSEYTYEDVTPLVADAIDRHSTGSRQYVSHVELRSDLLSEPHSRSIIENLRPTPKLKTPEAWAGVIIAGFSKQWTEGLWPRFERKKISTGHAWRLKR